MRMARIVWIYYISKFVEFFDTFFFIGRKKFAHVSALQVRFQKELVTLFTLVFSWEKTQ